MSKKDELQKLFSHILEAGVKKSDRTGVGTISTFGYTCRFNMKDGFPIVTTKKTAFKAAITELIWMIGGWMQEERYKGLQRTNIRFLLDNKCRIWTEWPYKAYVNYMENIPVGSTVDGRWVAPNGYNENAKQAYRNFTQQEFEEAIINDFDFAKQFGYLGPVYQEQWRNFNNGSKAVDQLAEMIAMLKKNPNDRRMLSSFWNPSQLGEMLLPPCHLLHQVWTRELTFEEKIQWVMKNTNVELENLAITEMAYDDSTPKYAISLQMYQRSSDCFLGVPFDWVFYSALLHILAAQTNMVAEEFIWVSGDTHLYLNSLDEVQQVLEREPYSYPTFRIKEKRDRVEDYKISDFELVDYKHHPEIKVKVAV